MRAAQALFTNAPGGVTGNDDLGTMSAWYLFSAVGLYPAVPGTGELLIHPPRFESVEMELGFGRVLRIEAPGTEGGGVQYIEGLSFNGTKRDRVWLNWDEIGRGGTLRFTLGSKPGPAWGTSPSALPVAPCGSR